MACDLQLFGAGECGAGGLFAVSSNVVSEDSYRFRMTRSIKQENPAIEGSSQGPLRNHLGRGPYDRS